MATATSRSVNKKRTAAVRIATVGIMGNNTNTAVAMSWISRWPAVKLAVSRTPNASGRMNRLIVSMIISTGIRGIGVPSGRRCPRATVGWFRMPIITVASHSGTASPMFRDSCVVGVKVYGRRPNMLIVMRNTIREASSSAHLCPPTLSGNISWLVNRLINHVWTVISRLFTHRDGGVGNSTHGSAIAMAMSGIPRKDGLANWSKKLTIMVSFRAQFYVSLRLLGLVRLVLYDSGFWLG